MNDKSNISENLISPTDDQSDQTSNQDQFSSSATPPSSEMKSVKEDEKTFETFESNDFEQNINSTGNKTSIKDFIQHKFSEVSAGTASKGIIVIILVAVLLGTIYTIFSSPEAVLERDKNEKELKLQQKKEELLKSAKAPTSSGDATIIQNQINPVTPKRELAPPAPPQITAPQPPSPAPPPVPLTPQAPVFPSSPTAGAVNTPPLATAPPQIGSIGNNQSSLSEVLSGDAEKKKQELLARRKASIIVTGGGGGSGGSAIASAKDAVKLDGSDAKSSSNKPKTSFLGFDNGVTVASENRTSSASSVKATNVGALDRMIAQGKIINAVLESAINTDIPGSLRAIVARDVFAENGNNILVPKGSRLIGSYSAQTKTGQTRVGIMWNRLIRPDGVDIAIASDGTDELGRTGVAGYADDKFWVKIGTAILTSYIVPVIAQKLLNVKDSQVVTTTTNGTGVMGTGPTSATTTTGSSASQQLQTTVQQLQNSINEAVKDAINTDTTVTIDQGTMVNVYVNKDLLFSPDQVYGATKVLK